MVGRWIASAGALALGVVMLSGPGRAQVGDRRVIEVVAERFAFTPSEIVVSAGEDVEIRLKSDDTAHGFRITGTSVSVVIPKRGGGEIAAAFRAPGPGRYPFECTRMCGAGHHFMRGVLVVREKTPTGGR